MVEISLDFSQIYDAAEDSRAVRKNNLAVNYTMAAPRTDDEY